MLSFYRSDKGHLWYHNLRGHERQEGACKGLPRVSLRDDVLGEIETCPLPQCGTTADWISYDDMHEYKGRQHQYQETELQCADGYESSLQHG